MAYADIYDGGKVNFLNNEISEAPDHLVIRELVVNAIEAGATECNFSYVEHKTSIGMVKKLICFDNGEGIPHEHMGDMINLHGSYGKEQGVKGNRGIGIRITGLNVSPYGLVFESCQNNTVLEVTLAWDEKAGQYSDNGGVTDISDSYSKNDRSESWTQVTFMGKDEYDDTTKDLWSGALTNCAIPTKLWERFFELPENFTISVESKLNGRSGGKHGTEYVSVIDSMKGTSDDYSIFELGPMTIHWFNMDKVSLKSDSRINTLAGKQAPVSGLVYENELFDTHRITNAAWTNLAGYFGFDLIAKKVAVVIELHDFPVGMNAFRNNLKWDAAQMNRGVHHKEEIAVMKHFAQEVKHNHPDWLKRILASKKKSDDDGLLDRLLKDGLELMKKYDNPVLALMADDEGDLDGGDEDTLTIVPPTLPGDSDTEIENPGDGRKVKPVKPRKQGKSMRATMKEIILFGIDIELISDPVIVADKKLAKYHIVSPTHKFEDRRIQIWADHPYLVSAYSDASVEYPELSDEEIKDVIHRYMIATLSGPFIVLMSQYHSNKWGFDSEAEALSDSALGFMNHSIMIAIEDSKKELNSRNIRTQKAVA